MQWSMACLSSMRSGCQIPEYNSAQYSFKQHPQKVLLLSGHLRPAGFRRVSSASWSNKACPLIYVAGLSVTMSQPLVQMRSFGPVSLHSIVFLWL